MPTIMSTPSSEIFIKGVTSAGKTFRPSDWAERLAGVLTSFGQDNRMSYSPYVRPTSIDGIKSVAIQRGLRDVEPFAFNFLMGFARDNDLLVIDDAQP